MRAADDSDRYYPAFVAFLGTRDADAVDASQIEQLSRVAWPEGVSPTVDDYARLARAAMAPLRR